MISNNLSTPTACAFELKLLFSSTVINILFSRARVFWIQHCQYYPANWGIIFILVSTNKQEASFAACLRLRSCNKHRTCSRLLLLQENKWHIRRAQHCLWIYWLDNAIDRCGLLKKRQGYEKANQLTQERHMRTAVMRRTTIIPLSTPQRHAILSYSTFPRK